MRALILATTFDLQEDTMNQTQTTASQRCRVAIVSANWHRDIVEQAVLAARAELARLRPEVRIDELVVPGAFEIPLIARRMAASGRVDAVIACALVVNGGVYRHEFVAGAVIDGLMRVQLETDVPHFSAVLTPRDFHEHDDHRAFFKSHFVKKGTEVAQACIQTLDALRGLPLSP